MSRNRLACVLALPLLAFGLSLGARAQTPEQAKALRTACEADVTKLCGSIEPGADRLFQCLKDHRDEVTPPCQATLGALIASQRKK
ncbi:cysteine rich repeat-containing protein [Xanthobacter oligotrophicus]|uniref:cysteine rich repeat-containing protein n=1 Tax=Xanthobacter oligotrophicus TaxID=2607286 RepID=UPI00165D5E3D|nr:cysteine rich repeat-containing protein [Xanthobacter oligotrophicus]